MLSMHIIESWRICREPRRICRPAVADSHHFNEDQEPDPDPQHTVVKKRDPDPHHSEKVGSRSASKRKKGSGIRIILCFLTKTFYLFLFLLMDLPFITEKKVFWWEYETPWHLSALKSFNTRLPYTGPSCGQCWGSGMFIPDPRSDFFHAGSRIRVFSIPDPHQRIYILTQKIVVFFKLSEIWSGLFTPDPDPDFFPIPDPGSRGQKVTRSRTWLWWDSDLLTQ